MPDSWSAWHWFFLLAFGAVFCHHAAGEKIEERNCLRASLLQELRRGEVPDTSGAIRLLAGASTDDTLLVASGFLALGDTGRARGLLRPWQNRLLPGAGGVEERRLLVESALGMDCSHGFLCLWREFRHAPVGRRALLALMEDSSYFSVEVMDLSKGDIRQWPRGDAGRWYLAAGALLARRGITEEAVDSWWKALDRVLKPWRSAVAGSLNVHVIPGQLADRRLVDLGKALLGAGEPLSVLSLIPEKGSGYRPLLLRAKALLLTGRVADGVVLLTRLTKIRFSEVAGEAYWELGQHHKRTDQDGAAARWYRSLESRFPRHRLAAKALWEAAWALERQEEWTEAGALYARVAKRWPTGDKAGRALLRYGLVAWREGDRAEAARRWEEAAPRVKKTRDKAAIGYWLGKAKMSLGALDEAYRWWAWAGVTDSLSFYGRRALWRLEAPRLVRRRRCSVRYPSLSPDPVAWVGIWSPGSCTGPIRELLDEARSLYRCGLIEQSGVTLQRASSRAGSSPLGLAEVLSVALEQECYRLVAITAGRLGRLFESQTDQESPIWLARLRLPVPYDDLLLAAAARWRLDYRLVSALMRKESMYARTVESRAGAIGLMQLLPSTARELAKAGHDPDPPRITEARTNMELGCSYLSRLSERNDGHIVLALAAYNAGPHNKKRWVGFLGFDDQELWVESITYGETRDYIRGVLELTWQYQTLWSAIRRVDIELPAILPPPE